MDLREFTSKTIQEICEGVADAKDSTNKLGAIVSPKGLYRNNEVLFLSENGLRHGTEIEFDVAITTSEGSSKEGGAKIQVLNLFGLGGNASADKNLQQASRVKFTVNVVLP